MERLAMQYLDNWKVIENGKPIIILRSRQVGKTWLMKEFGKRKYSQIAYVNFESGLAMFFYNFGSM